MEEEYKLDRNQKHCEAYCRKTLIARCLECNKYVSAIAHNWNSNNRESSCIDPSSDKKERWLQCRKCGEVI